MTGSIDEVRIYNRALSAQEIKDHATIVAAYNFDEGKDNIGATGLNNVMIFDVSAHANDGIANSTGSFEWTNGIVGSAINFNGDDWVEVPDSTSLKMTDAITVEAWVKNDNINDPWSRIVTKGKHFTNQNYGWMIDFQDVSGGKTAVNFYVEIDGTQDSSGNSGYIIEQSKWYHVVGTFDGDYIKIYVNGELKNSKYHPGTITETGGPYNVLIGKSYGWEEFLTGSIDEVRIYNRAKVLCACEEALYGGNVSNPEEKINSLRELRDEFLRDKYMYLYYEYNPEIRGILIEEPYLLVDAANLLVKYIPAVNYVIGKGGEDLKIEEEAVTEAISFIENLKKEIWERREEIGINRSSNIIEFLEKSEKQVNASKGKTFSQAFRDSIYARWPVNETKYKNSITQPIDVSKIHYKFKAVDEEWAAKWTNLLLYGQKKTKYSIEIYLNETGYVTCVDFERWGFPITEIPYDLANQSLASLPPGFALDP